MLKTFIFRSIQQVMKQSLLFLFFLLLISCQDQKKLSQDNTVTVRLPAEPDRINPLLSISGYSAQIAEQTFMPLLQFDIHSLKLEPVLAVSLPDHTTDEQSGEVSYVFEIRPEAVWTDGSPVTAKDYEFTLKAIMNPKINAGIFRSYFGFLKDFVPDKENAKRFTVIASYSYLLAETALGNIAVYPEYLFDPKGMMQKFSVQELCSIKNENHPLLSDQQLIGFAQDFNKRRTFEKGILPGGCGPYNLVDWQAGQQLTLQKKEDWWGTKYAKDSPSFQAFPEQIIFKFIPDIEATKSLLQNQELDVVGSVDQRVFNHLKEDEIFQKNYNTYSPSKLMYYYIGLNRKNECLSSPKLRRAFAHLLDLDQAKETVYYDMVQRTIGPFHPQKDYYNKSLPPIKYTIEKAKQLFKEEGWSDSNSNGILDKKIGTELVEMDLTLDVSSSVEAGRQLGIIFQEAAKKAGVKIRIEGKEFSKLSADYKARDYDMVYSAWSNFAGPDDPKQLWHRESDRSDGANRVGFGTKESDDLIDKIQSSTNSEERRQLFFDLQKIIYDDQPYLFLFAPQERIVAHKRFEAPISVRRPGFFPNTFQLLD